MEDPLDVSPPGMIRHARDAIIEELRDTFADTAKGTCVGLPGKEEVRCDLIGDKASTIFRSVNDLLTQGLPNSLRTILAVKTNASPIAQRVLARVSELPLSESVTKQ